MSIIGGNQNLQDGNIYLDGPQLNPGVMLNELGLELSEANQLSQANANYALSLEFLNAKIKQAKDMQSGLIATAQQHMMQSLLPFQLDIQTLLLVVMNPFGIRSTWVLFIL